MFTIFRIHGYLVHIDNKDVKRKIRGTYIHNFLTLHVVHYFFNIYCAFAEPLASNMFGVREGPRWRRNKGEFHHSVEKYYIDCTTETLPYASGGSPIELLKWATFVKWAIFGPFQ